MKRSEDFFKAVEGKSNISKQLQEEIVERIYRASKGLTVEPTVTEPTPSPSWLTRNAKYLVLAFSLVVLVFTLTGCADSHETLSIEPVKPKEAVVEPAIVVEPTPQVVAEPSETPKAKVTKPEVKVKSEKVVPTPKTTASTVTKMSNAELAIKYPPAIGTLVPWYSPTPEQAGKAYTNLKPYQTGKTYALYQEENSLLLVYPGVGTTNLDGDTVVWTAIRINKVTSEQIKILENQKTSYGMNIIKVLGCEADSCGGLISGNSMQIENIPSKLEGVLQKWTTISSIR